MRGNAMDKSIEMNYYFLWDTIDFLIKNLDQVLMMTIIIFLVMAWTWAFEWKCLRKKILFYKKISVLKLLNGQVMNEVVIWLISMVED